jgi:putative acetyltransferase
MVALAFTIEDPSSDEVRLVLDRHLRFATSVTPPSGVFALDVSGLQDPSVTVFGARRDGELLGIGAIKMLPEGLAELKSMHTLEASRGQGVGKALVERLIAEARARGCSTLKLETGTMDAFGPARSLYSRCGFLPCEQFGEYVGSSTSACMSMDLVGANSASEPPG